MLYDFGCVKTLAAHVLPSYLQLVRGGLRRDFEQVERALQDLGVRTPDTPPPVQLYEALRTWLAMAFMHSESFDFGTARLEQDALRDIAPLALRTIGAFRPAGELVFFNRTIAGLYAVLKKLRARVPVQRMLVARAPDLAALLA